MRKSKRKSPQSRHNKKEQERTTRKKKAFLEVYFKNVCNISATCEKIGIDRKTFYNWKEADPEFRRAVEDAENQLIDLAETQLFKNIRAGKETSLFFFLVNRKPERWKSITKVQMEHSGEVKTTPSVSIINVLNKKDEKTGRKIGEIISEALGKKRE